MEGKRGWGNSGKQFGKYYLIVLTPNLPQQYIDYRHFPVLYSLLEKMDWQLSDLIVYEFHWKRLINKDECDGRTCIFIVCLTSTHLNLETLFKRRILVLRTETSSQLQLRSRYLVNFDAVLRFSLSSTCDFAVFVPPLRPAPFTKRSSELKFGGIFFEHYWLSLLSQKVCCLLSSAVLLLIKVHFFEEQVIGLHDLQKDHDLFLPFLHTMSATDDTWNMSALLCCLFVCMFFFYVLSSYKRAWGQHKACLRLKVIRHIRQSQAKKKQFHLARYEVKQVHIL